MIGTLQKTERPCIAAFPLGGDYKKWVNDLAEILWGDVEELFSPLLELECDRLIYPAPTAKGWHRLSDGDSGEWERVSINDMPACMVVDVESDQDDHGKWEPFLCVALSEYGWYCWQGDGGLIPMLSGTLLIGQNASRHDSQFFESEYQLPSKDKTAYIDTMALASQVRGIPPSAYDQFEKFQKNLANGKGVPAWVSKACKVNLADAVKSFLGFEINKTVQGDILNGVTAPETIFEYCCQDVWATLKLFQFLYPLCRQVFMPSPVTWWGQLAVTGLRYPVASWPIFTDWLREEYDAAKSVKHSDRSGHQSELVNWGKNSLLQFEKATSASMMMPCRFLPSDVLGAVRSDIWSHWVELDGEWSARIAEKGDLFPLAALSNASNFFKEVCFSLPIATAQTKAHSKIMASQSVLKTKILERRCPESFSGEEVKCEWLERCDQPDIMAAFITIMDAFIEEYELDAWLAIPGLNNCLYAIKGDEKNINQLRACGAEASRIVEAFS